MNIFFIRFPTIFILINNVVIGMPNQSLLTEFQKHKFLINSPIVLVNRASGLPSVSRRRRWWREVLIFPSVTLSRIPLIASSHVSGQQLVYWLIKRTLYSVKMPPGRPTCKSHRHAIVAAGIHGLSAQARGGEMEKTTTAVII